MRHSIGVRRAIPVGGGRGVVFSTPMNNGASCGGAYEIPVAISTSLPLT